jgi:hypothetical protein
LDGWGPGGGLLLLLLCLLASLEFIPGSTQLVELLDSQPDVFARVADGIDSPADNEWRHGWGLPGRQYSNMNRGCMCMWLQLAVVLHGLYTAVAEGNTAGGLCMVPAHSSECLREGEPNHLKGCLALHITQLNFLLFLSSWPWKVLQKAHCRATKV